jgi:FixJ family two-component response regulator
LRVILSTTRALPRSPKVIVVDDDEEVVFWIRRVLGARGLLVEGHAGLASLLARPPQHAPSCILLEWRVRGTDDLALVDELRRLGHGHPLVFMGCGVEVPDAVHAMKRGALDFLLKPLREEALLDAVDRCLRVDDEALRSRAVRIEARGRVATLTQREQQVCSMVMQGMVNKQIAAELGVAESTVKVHRSRLMRKLGTPSLVDLTRLVDRANPLALAS